MAAKQQQQQQQNCNVRGLNEYTERSIFSL